MAFFFHGLQVHVCHLGCACRGAVCGFLLLARISSLFGVKGEDTPSKHASAYSPLKPMNCTCVCVCLCVRVCVRVRACVRVFCIPLHPPPFVSHPLLGSPFCLCVIHSTSAHVQDLCCDLCVGSGTMWSLSWMPWRWPAHSHRAACGRF